MYCQRRQSIRVDSPSAWTVQSNLTQTKARRKNVGSENKLHQKMRRLKAQLMGMFSGKSQPPPPLIQLIYLTQPQIGWAAIPPLKSLRCEQAPDEKIGSNKLISIPNPNPVIRSKFSPELAEFTSAKVKCGGKRRARPL